MSPGGHLEKKNVQLNITPRTPGQCPTSLLSDSLKFLVMLIEAMCNKEKQSYENALLRLTADYGPPVPNGEERGTGGLEKAYCSAVYNKNLINLVADGVCPLLQVLVSHLRGIQQKRRISKVKLMF